MARKSAAAKQIDLTEKLASLVPSKPSAKIELVVTGHEDLVDRAIERGKQLDSLKTEQDADLDQIRALGLAEMQQAEETGRFTKTAYVAGSETKAAVTRKDAFSKIAPENEKTLCEIIGADLFDRLFECRKDVKLTGNFEVLESLCDKAGIDLNLFFDTTEYLAPKDNYLENRARLRLDLTKEQNYVLDAVTLKMAYAPSIKLK